MLGAWKTVQQVAALPFVVAGGGIEVLLVTTRERGRWIVPKGWPKAGVSLGAAAAEEAWEEAGLRGHLVTKPIGRYRYPKRMSAGYEVPSGVLVYPLLVAEQSLDWPERAQRRTAWFALEAAAALVEDRGLSRLLARLARDDAAKLREIASRLGASEREPA